MTISQWYESMTDSQQRAIEHAGVEFGGFVDSEIRELIELGILKWYLKGDGNWKLVEISPSGLKRMPLYISARPWKRVGVKR